MPGGAAATGQPLPPPLVRAPSTAALTATGFIARKHVAAVAALLGHPTIADELRPSGSGWTVAAAFDRSTVPSATAAPGERAIPLADLAAWWAEETGAAAVTAFVCQQAFPGAVRTERHGSLLRFALPSAGHGDLLPHAGPISPTAGGGGGGGGGGGLATMFALLEAGRVRLGYEFSIGQQTLEQVFNAFAAQQELDEKGSGKGGASAAAQTQPAALPTALAAAGGRGRSAMPPTTAV
jgi:hypothetical protein